MGNGEEGLGGDRAMNISSGRERPKRLRGRGYYDKAWEIRERNRSGKKISFQRLYWS